MKQLYNVQSSSSIKYVGKNGVINHVETLNGCSISNITYGEPPKWEYNEITDWYDFVTNKNKKMSFRDRFVLDCNNFIEYTESTFVNIINPSDIHMEKLIKELSVDQFIEYMKDNGLGMESVK